MLFRSTALTTHAIEPIKRVSGTGYPKGNPAVRHMKFKQYNKATKLYDIDTDKIKGIINTYIKDTETSGPEITTTNTKTGEISVTTLSGVLSRVGLRRRLDIHRETYSLWLRGYVNRADIEDETVINNITLSDALRAGDDAIIEYLVTNQSKYGQTKDIRLLETYGEIIGKDKQAPAVAIQVNLGVYEQYAK